MKINTSSLKKFGFRFLVVVIVFFLVKFTMDPDKISWSINRISTFYFLSAFVLFMYAWETNDWLIKRFLNNDCSILNLNSGLKILGINMLAIIPITAGVYYLGLFILEMHCLGPDADLWLQFRIDFFRALLLGFAVIVFNLFYFFLTQKKELDLKMYQLQQQLISAQYQSLKDQISPHFLFNSLNTLTSLMYEDRDLAADYISRLASCYRYILDHKDRNIIDLKQELSFLDSFIFMMTIRHPEALNININIDEKLHHYKIPTLTLQMLLENALKHNTYSPQKPLNITISSDDNTSISILNNLQTRKHKEETTCVGIKNIKKRYSFHTDEQVVIDSNDSYYKIKIPLISKS